MNSHQRRKLRRLYERAFGNHVDYLVTINVEDDDSYWKPNIQAVIEGEHDPYVLATWDEASQAYYFDDDWQEYDGMDLDHIYVEWLERHPGAST